MRREPIEKAAPRVSQSYAFLAGFCFYTIRGWLSALPPYPDHFDSAGRFSHSLRRYFTGIDSSRNNIAVICLLAAQIHTCTRTPSDDRMQARARKCSADTSSKA